MATEDLANIRELCVESLNGCMDYISKYLDGDEKNTKVKELMSYIQGYCFLDEVITSEDFQGRISEGDSVDDISNKIAELCPNSEHINHNYMKAFLKKSNQYVECNNIGPLTNGCSVPNEMPIEVSDDDENAMEI